MGQNEHQYLLDALAAIDPATLGYQEWVDVGMALHESGYTWSDWDVWSQRDPRRYHPGECESKWSGFGNGSERVASGTIIHMAELRGWSQPGSGMGQALGWGDSGTVTAGPDALGADAQPIEDTDEGDWDPCGMLSDYLGTLFEDDDIVGYVVNCWERDGRKMPKQGDWSRTAGQLRQELASPTATMDKVLGAWDEEAGAWIRFNPLDGHGCGNANVTDYRYALVESDVLDLDKQFPAIKDMRLPCAAVVSSGGKSVHAIVRVDAPNKAEYDKRVRWLYDYCDRHGFICDKQNKNASRLSRLPGATRNGRRQLLLATNIGERDWDSWKRWAEESEDDLPDAENMLDRLMRHEPLAEPIIGTEDRGILRIGHKMLVQGPSKAGKSILLTELAIAVAAGGAWMGYPCRQGKVLYVNLEIDSRSMDDRVRKIASDPMSQVDGCEDPRLANIDVWNLRGKACPMNMLAPRLIRRMREKSFSMVIIDPIYKVITGDENSASDMALFCNQFDFVAEQTGASVVYCHHHSKGKQGGKNAIDRGSGSGVFGRDPDAILDIAPIELTEERANELGETTCWRVTATLREFKSPKPVDLYFRYPVHIVDLQGSLAKNKIEGEDPLSRQQIMRDQRRREKVESDRLSKIEALTQAIRECADDDVLPTVDNVASRIGCVGRIEDVTNRHVRDWCNPKRVGDWTPFRIDTVKGIKDVIVDTRESREV